MICYLSYQITHINKNHENGESTVFLFWHNKFYFTYDIHTQTLELSLTK